VGNEHAADGSIMGPLSEYLATARQQRLPDDVVSATRHHVLDTIASMVSGAELDVGDAVRRYVVSMCGGRGEVPIAGTTIDAPTVLAAMANGMLAHADETDDSHEPSRTHPGCSIVSAALAMLQRFPCDGATFLRAVAAGYDVGTRIVRSLGADEITERSRATHAIGPTFGAAVAAGTVVGFDAQQARALLSYAAQQASGLRSWERDPDHIEKAFVFGGMPARNGVTAALFVAHGFTGVDDVFSGVKNFFDAFTDTPTPHLAVAELGHRFEVTRTNIKRWTVGSPIQAAASAVEALLEERPQLAKDVERVVVRLSQEGARVVRDRAIPSICLEHIVSVMLVDGHLDFENSHDITRMDDPVVRRMRERVVLLGDESLDGVQPPRQAIVEITTQDGSTFSHHVRAVLGTADNPMDQDQVETKARGLLLPTLGEGPTEELIAAVRNLDDATSAVDLHALLRPQGRDA